MNTDIRISVVFWRHPKTVKLERRLGIEAIKSLIILWMWVACNRPDGNLEGFDAEDIEIAAEWRGEPGVLVEVLLSLRWLDMEDGQYKIHDWAEHNSWASEAECRSDVARFSKLAQVNPAACEELRRLGISSLTPEEYQEWKNYSPIIHQRIASERTANASDSHSKRKANASGALAPSPSPSLKIKEKDPPPSPPGGNPRCAPPVAHLPPEGARPPDEGGGVNKNQAPEGAGTQVNPENARNGAAQGTARNGAEKPSEYPAEFEAFWAAYPRRVAKHAAYTVWKKTARNGADQADTVTAARNYAAQMRAEQRPVDKILHPETFLRKERWQEYVRGAPGTQAADGGITDAEKQEIIKKYTNEEGQRDDRAIWRELRALEHERGAG